MIQHDQQLATAWKGQERVKLYSTIKYHNNFNYQIRINSDNLSQAIIHMLTAMKVSLKVYIVNRNSLVCLSTHHLILISVCLVNHICIFPIYV